MPLIRNCKLCDTKFETKPSAVANGCGKYCSRECGHKAQRKGKDMECYLCGKYSYKSKTNLGRSKSGKFFCSKSCQTKWRNQEFAGPKHANWKGGRASYRELLERNNIPKICNLCKIGDERVMSAHHIDRNRKNNCVENLAWLCHNCHHLVHHHKDEQDKFMAVLV